MEARSVWLAFSVLRVAWVLLPQSGYIHPDEFFQSPEVMAGAVLDYKVHLTWEWNEDFPARSPLFPYLTSGIPFLVLKTINSLGLLADSTSAYVLLITPRLWTAVLSFCIDFCLYKICNSVGAKWKQVKMDGFRCLAVFSASYVTLVLFTRTFSNVLEAVLFAAIIALILDPIQVGKPETIHDKNKTESATDEDFPDIINGQDLSHSHPVLLSGLIVVGFFNRPTFLAFALVPMMYWAFCPIHQNNGSWLKDVISKVLCLVPGAMLTFGSIVVCDSIYFGSLNFQNVSVDAFLHSPTGLFQNLTVTPLNLLSYNFDKSKLEQHGLHPRVTHLLVNTPLLFGVLAILAFLDLPHFGTKILSYLKQGKSKTEMSSTEKDSGSKQRTQQKKEGHISSTDSTKGLLLYPFTELDVEIFFLLCYFIPILILSVVPHHEPRYISPCLIPLVLAFHNRLVWKGSNKLVFGGFVAANILGGVLFGVLHQGGVVPSLLHLHRVVHNQQSTEKVHIIYFHTYMPPGHLLGIHSNQTSNQNTDNIDMLPKVTNEKAGPEVHLHDLAGASVNVLSKELNTLYHQKQVGNNARIYIVSPSTLHHTLNMYDQRTNMSIVLLEVFFPHLSMEDPPNVWDIVQIQSEKDSTLLERLKLMFGLNLYEVI